MDTPPIALLSITPLYVALLGLLWVPLTLRVGLYRLKNQINLGDGGDQELLQRIRGQGNYTESVPIALVLLVVMELSGASATWLHALGALLLVGRLSHYLGITRIGPSICRPFGMVATITVYLVSGIWLLVAWGG